MLILCLWGSDPNSGEPNAMFSFFAGHQAMQPSTISKDTGGGMVSNMLAQERRGVFEFFEFVVHAKSV